MAHAHDHDHNHDHTHDTDTYYLDQLCMIGITGAFAGICLTLYFFNSGMLNLLLNDQFHLMVLAAGVALLFVVLVRAAILWKAVGNKPAGPAHAHEHHHLHEHGDHHHADEHHHHEHCGHDHHHEEHLQQAVQLAPSPAPPALATHSHDHDHDHSHTPGDGHEHGWAPWRYVVLLVPLMLYLLGLPNKALPLGSAGAINVNREAMLAARLIGMGETPLAQTVFAGTMTLNVDEHVAPVFVDSNQVSVASLKPGMKVWMKLVVDNKVVGNKGAAAVWATNSSGSPAPSPDVPWMPMGVVKAVNPSEKTVTVAAAVDSQTDETFDLEATEYIAFKQLEQLAFDARSREEYGKKKVQVIGQFVPFPGSDHYFSLSRLRIQCCGADAIQLNVPIQCRESVTGYRKQDWVRVTGRIEFREHPGRPGAFGTILIVNRRNNIVPTNPDPDPYVR
jgi:hypothetical protein